MKTHLINLKKQLEHWNENLKVEETLCNSSWEIFSDDTSKDIFVFQKDGTLLVSTGGVVKEAKWQYLAPAGSILIKGMNRKSYMMKPYTQEGKIILLNLEGTQEFAILINQNYKDALKINSMQDIRLYLNGHAELEKKQEEQKTENKKKAEKEKKETAAKEKKNKAAWISYIEKETQIEARSKEGSDFVKAIKKALFISVGSFVGVETVLLIVLSFLNLEMEESVGIFVIATFVQGILLFLYIRSIWNRSKQFKAQVEKRHPYNNTVDYTKKS